MDARKSFSRVKAKSFARQTWAVMIINTILMTFGMSCGFTTILITRVYEQDSEERFVLDEVKISWIGSISPFFSALGCLCFASVNHALGAKMSMHLASVFFLVAWLVFKSSDTIWQMFFALALSGFMGGLVEATILVYVEEVAQSHLRGYLSASTMFCNNFGTLLVFLLGTCFSWRAIALLSSALPVASFSLLFFVPESPHWLVGRERFSEARKSLMWLRATSNLEDIEEEFKEISLVVKLQRLHFDEEGKFSLRNFAWSFSTVCFAFFLVHYTGVTTFQTYAVWIFATVGAPADKYRATIFFGLAKCLGSLASGLLDRRFMCYVSVFTSAICYSNVALYAYMMDIRYFNLESSVNSNLHACSSIATTLLNFATFVACSGLRTLPWMLMGEVYSFEARVIGTGVSGAVYYFFGFFANKIFLQMVYSLTLPGTFWFYALMSLFGVLVLCVIMPSVDGKTYQEALEHS